MKNGLTAIDAGVSDETISVLSDAFVACDLLRHAEEMSDERFVFDAEGADRFDVLVRHDQDVSPRHGVNIAEGGRLVIVVYDLSFGAAGDDLAEDTGVAHGMSDPCCAGDKVNDKCAEHRM